MKQGAGIVNKISFLIDSFPLPLFYTTTFGYFISYSFLISIVLFKQFLFFHPAPLPFFFVCIAFVYKIGLGYMG